jgi:hypothetical protein
MAFVKERPLPPPYYADFTEGVDIKRPDIPADFDPDEQYNGIFRQPGESTDLSIAVLENQVSANVKENLKNCIRKIVEEALGTFSSSSDAAACFASGDRLNQHIEKAYELLNSMQLHQGIQLVLRDLKLQVEQLKKVKIDLEEALNCE